MLNPVPIQFLALFAYFLLRVCVGVILVHLGLKHIYQKNDLKIVFDQADWPHGTFFILLLAVFELLVGVLFIVGAFTQVAAFLTMLMCLAMLVVRNWFDHPVLPQKLFYVLLLGTAVSLFITGAGAFAYDLPI